MRFEKGNAGRPKGAVNRRTLQQHEVLELLASGDRELPTRTERLKRLLLDADPRIRLETERLLLVFDFRKPPPQRNSEADTPVVEAILNEIWRKERERFKALNPTAPETAADITKETHPEIPGPGDIDEYNPGWPGVS
jgi:hypothetical protein